MGIGGLLMEGIGDTIRVSLTDAPEKEVRAGYDILRAAGHFVPGPEVISCPTCGRTNINVAQIAGEVEERLRGCNKQIKVAVMGCVVNGPGAVSYTHLDVYKRQVEHTVRRDGSADYVHLINYTGYSLKSYFP